MSTFIRSGEAARILGVQRATLYAYVSRGLLTRRTAVDGRTSLYALDEVEQLARRSRRPPPGPRPSIDVSITSAITTLDERDLRYRGRSVGELATTATFEQVAELLWTGELPAATPVWPPPSDGDAAAVDRVVDALGANAEPLERLVAIATTLGARHRDEAPVAAARRLLALASRALERRDERRPDAAPALAIADALASSLAPTDRDADPGLAAALQRALVLLADHELATSTLAVRVAASVRCDAWAAMTAGLATLRGRLHGSAAPDAHRVLVDAADVGARAAIAHRRDAGAPIAGFGHSIYRDTDPRFDVLLDAVRTLDDPHARMAVVDDLLVEAGRVLPVRPNVDLALGALSFVSGIDPDAPLFAVARIAGWAAHLDEELTERPLRFRGVSRPVR